MQRRAGHPASPGIYLALNAAALLAAGVLMILLAPSGGLSTLRLILIGGTLLLAALTAAATVLLLLRRHRDEPLHRAFLHTATTRWFPPSFGALFIIFWYLTWIRPEDTGKYYYYFIGLYPLILCGTLASGSALIFTIAETGGFTVASWRRYWPEHRLTLVTALISLLGFAVVAILAGALRIFATHEPYWRGASVPILAQQVFLTVIIAVLALQLETSLRGTRIISDRVLFLLIWAVSAFFWARQPVGASSWLTGPMPPNREYYPYSDLATYDLGSQFALIGQGINNHVFFDRALYMSFLVYLHGLGGQNYQHLMAIQAAIFAVFPALAYLIGRRLHSRTAGLILATLTTLRGVNSLIAVDWIHSATFKHMLTDFPTGIGLAVFVLLILRWLQEPQAHRPDALWAAGVLGLTSLLRPHVLLLLPLPTLAALWMYRSRWQRSLIFASLMLLAFLGSISPWIFLGSGVDSVLAFYGQRVSDVMQQRYPQANGAAVESEALPPALAESGTPLPLATPGAAAPVPRMPPPSPTGLPFQLTHFMHGLVTSALVFPNSPEFLSVRATVLEGEPFWELRWNGQMSARAAAMLMLNLGLIATGLGAAYQRLRWRGLIPLIVFVVYQAANALARTSGGRYMVPADWIIVCYFGLGLAELVRVASLAFLPDGGLPEPPASVPPRPVQLPFSMRTLAPIAMLGLIGGLVPIAGILYPLRYPAQTSSTLVNRIEPYLLDMKLTQSEMNSFLAQPGAVILYGRTLYPRFYPQDSGEPVKYGPFRVVNYPRMVFLLIGPHGLVYAVLPGEAPKVFLNSGDAILLGCRALKQGFDEVHALAVVLPGRGVSYARAPAAPLACPLPEPVCDSAGSCK